MAFPSTEPPEPCSHVCRPMRVVSSSSSRKLARDRICEHGRSRRAECWPASDLGRRCSVGACGPDRELPI